MARTCDTDHWQVAGVGGGPEIHSLDDILLTGCRGPDCGTHRPPGVTTSRTSALTVEFWGLPVNRSSSSRVWRFSAARIQAGRGLGWRPRSWACLPPALSGSPLQAGRLQTWMVSGLSPSHCPTLLALVRHTTCRCWMPSPQVAEHCHDAARAGPGHSGPGRAGGEREEGGSELQSSQCPGQKRYRERC